MTQPPPAMGTAMRAVRFDRYGDLDELQVVAVADPVASGDRVVVAVRAAAVNPGEASIRSGALEHMFPTTFPCGEGSDLAGVVTAVGPAAVGVTIGDEVLGWSDERSSHADLVAVPAGQLLLKPPTLSWEVAGSLYVAGLAAVGALSAVEPVRGQTVAVSGASGGVGLFTIQLLAARGVTVLAIAGEDSARLVESLGARHVSYGADLEAGLRAAAPAGIDAWIDVAGGGYVALALRLGLPARLINTIIDFAAAAANPGVQQQGTSAVADPAGALAELTQLVAGGRVQVPIAATYPLERVRAAYTDLARGHTHGKIVLIP